MKVLLGKLKQYLNKYWPIYVLVILSLIFYWPVLFQNKVPLPADALVGAHVPWTEVKWPGYPAGVPIQNQEITDAISQFYPWRSLAGEFWRNSKPPLWNPYMFSGYPFLANLHSASLYPLNAVYLVLNDINAWSLLIYLQIVLAGVFTYLFLNKIGVNKSGSLLGGLIFSYSGYMIAWLEFATGGHAGLWLPLLLYFQLQYFNEKSTIWIIPPVIIFFFIFTAGDFQVPFYITIIFITFGLFNSFRQKRMIDKKMVFVKTIVVLFLGIAVSAVQLIPAINLYLDSIRVDDPYIQEYFYGIMHWKKAILFLWPDFYGNVVTRNYWGQFGYHEYYGFMGSAAILFLFFNLLTKKGRYEKYFWTVLVISLLFLFPTPLAFLPFKLSIPGLGTSSASRIIYLVNFSVAVLAGLGMSKLSPKKLKLTQNIAVVYLFVAVAVVASLLGTIHFKPANALVIQNLKVATRNMIPPTLVVAFIYLLIRISELVPIKKYFGQKKAFNLIVVAVFIVSIIELQFYANKNTPFSPREFVFPKTKIIEFLENQKKPFRIAGGIPLNLFMPYKFESAEGYDSLYPARNSMWYSLVNSGNLKSLSGRYGLIHSVESNLINYSNIKYLIDYKKNIYGGIAEKGDHMPGVSDNFKEVFREGRIGVFENKNVLPRIWGATDYQIAKSDEELISKLSALKKGEKTIILESEINESIDTKSVIKISNYNQYPNRIEFDSDSDGKALLFISQSYNSGWKAYVNGQETPIYRANFLFQAIAVPNGLHNIMLIFNPHDYDLGRTITITGFITTISLGATGFLRVGKRFVQRYT